jgi:Ca2+-binding EF-hand superfamily protein
MKTTKLITLGALLGTCAFATAQDKPKRDLPPEVVAKFDTDKDGKLSDDERKAMRTEMKAQQEKRHAAMLEKYDADKDGKLSADEKATMKKEMEAKRAAILEKYDADKDGKLSPAEIKTARDAGEDIPPPGMGRGPGGKGGKRGPGGPDGPPPAPPAE